MIFFTIVNLLSFILPNTEAEEDKVIIKESPDSIFEPQDEIYKTIKDCALISKWAGGIGLHVHNIRAAGSHIRGTNGTSNGLIPMLGVYNKTARYVDQGGKRNGSFAIYYGDSRIVVVGQN